MIFARHFMNVGVDPPAGGETVYSPARAPARQPGRRPDPDPGPIAELTGPAAM